MNSPVSPYLKIHGTVNDMIGENTIKGKAMRKNLFPHQRLQDLLVMIRLAKKPERMKNNGIRQICMNWKMAFINCDELLSVGQKRSASGTYGNAACNTIPWNIAMPRMASNPWYLIESPCTCPPSLVIKAPRDTPHFLQNRTSSELSLPHAGQFI